MVLSIKFICIKPRPVIDLCFVCSSVIVNGVLIIYFFKRSRGKKGRKEVVFPCVHSVGWSGQGEGSAGNERDSLPLGPTFGFCFKSPISNNNYQTPQREIIIIIIRFLYIFTHIFTKLKKIIRFLINLFTKLNNSILRLYI
jgi:hypothetical protein